MNGFSNKVILLTKVSWKTLTSQHSSKQMVKGFNNHIRTENVLELSVLNWNTTQVYFFILKSIFSQNFCSHEPFPYNFIAKMPTNIHNNPPEKTTIEALYCF